MPIEERIRRLEDNYMERKPCFKYDISIKGPNRDREKQIFKSIAGFLNTNGGILFIGIDNEGNVLGLRNDYSVVKNNNADGFQLELRNSIESFLKKKIVNELLEVKFPSVKSEEICEITIRPSSEPIVLNDNGIEEFYVREGNSTKPYRLTQAIEYCKKRFQSYDF
jgi:predicted HTH transcriptional regulator